jgi:hypothetical protein
MRAIGCNQCWYSPFIGGPHQQVWGVYMFGLHFNYHLELSLKWMTSSHHLMETNNRKQTSACHSAEALQKPTINEVTKGLQDNEIILFQTITFQNYYSIKKLQNIGTNTGKPRINNLQFVKTSLTGQVPHCGTSHLHTLP